MVVFMDRVKSYSPPFASNLRKEALSLETFNGVEELRQTLKGSVLSIDKSVG